MKLLLCVYSNLSVRIIITFVTLGLANFLEVAVQNAPICTNS